MTKLIKRHQQQIKWILMVFTTWRVGLFVVAMVAPYFLTYSPSFPYSEMLTQFGLPAWVYSWANFDGVHYLTIANKGYIGTGLIQAFFPVFPLAVDFLSSLTGLNLMISGLLLSNLFGLIFTLVWFFFIKETFSEKLAKLSTIIFLSLPSSLFLGAFYTESLFLSLCLGSFWAAKRDKWWLAGGLTAVASATRVTGILLVPALLLELLWPHLKINTVQNTFKGLMSAVSKFKIELAWVLLGVLGLLAYSYFLFREFSDPLYFFHVQAEFGGIRQESLVLYPQVIWRYLKILASLSSFNLTFVFTLVQEFLVATLGLLLLLWSAKKIKISHAFFGLSAFILPTLTGTFSSLPRYALVSFPLVLAIAFILEKYKKFMPVYLAVSIFLLICNTILFIQGYWVA